MTNSIPNLQNLEHTHIHLHIETLTPSLSSAALENVWCLGFQEWRGSAGGESRS
jgi:hypothetical protein